MEFVEQLRRELVGGRQAEEDREFIICPDCFRKYVEPELQEM